MEHGGEGGEYIALCRKLLVNKHLPSIVPVQKESKQENLGLST